MGLAMAAQAATEKVSRLGEDEPEFIDTLKRMNDEAAETERRCAFIVDTIEGKKTAIHDEAMATKRKGAEMMKTYLDDDSDALDGFEFLTMAEAGEAGHWKVLKTMTDRDGNARIAELCRWAIPIQERHLSDVDHAALKLAAAEDPAAISG
jgi:hypothetical protein